MARYVFLSVLVLLTATVTSAQEKPVDVPISGESAKFRLVGKLHEPLGSVVTVQGVVVDGPFKGYEGGPNLRVQKINGRATQEHIQIRLSPYFHRFGEEVTDGPQLPRLVFGKTYEFEGFETGGFVGVPGEAYRRAEIMLQTTGHYFSHILKVYLGKQIDPIVWSPADFLDRTALITGVSANEQERA